jgi:hypothetical protein
MKFDGKFEGAGKDRMAGAAKLTDDLNVEPELARVLGDFRATVHAWSDATSNRPRIVVGASRHDAYRRPLVWGMGCLLTAVVAVGGVEEMQHRQELARVEALRQVEQQRQMLEQRTRESEELLAKVDSDVSREVPDALEPLAQLMTDDESR